MPQPAAFWKTMTKPQRAAFYIGISIITSIALLMLVAYVIQTSYVNKVMPLTTVAGLSLGGSSADTAAQILADQAQWLTETKISLELGNVKQTVNTQELGLSLDPVTAEAKILTPQGQFDWLKLSFWKEFLRPKTVALTFGKSDDELQKLIAQKFNISDTPKDASLSVVNGVLTVIPDAPGETMNIAKLKTSLTHFFQTGNSTAIALIHQSQTPATITAAAVATVKDQITNALHPIKLTANNKSATISVADQYTLIDYTTENATLKWQISESKLTSYLQNVATKKLNVKAVQQVIENNTNRMITTGVNGSAVDVSALEPLIFQAMTTTTTPATIEAPVKPVAFTETHVNPSYSLNLFPTLYLDVSLSTQTITIINVDTVISQYRISSGGWKTPTPIGTFYIFNKIKLAYSPDFKLWMPDWNGLATSPNGQGYLGYGLHAIVCWDKACTNREGANHIGTPVSHGCIRVADDGIAYIYDQVPIGTPVVIHQ